MRSAVPSASPLPQSAVAAATRAGSTNRSGSRSRVIRSWSPTPGTRGSNNSIRMARRAGRSRSPAGRADRFSISHTSQPTREDGSMSRRPSATRSSSWMSTGRSDPCHCPGAEAGGPRRRRASTSEPAASCTSRKARAVSSADIRSLTHHDPSRRLADHASRGRPCEGRARRDPMPRVRAGRSSVSCPRRPPKRGDARPEAPTSG